jgi:hypothetical protein
MARFLGAHLNGGMFNGRRILSEASVKEMHEPQFGGAYGFGFFVRKNDNGHTIISHGGGIPGQSSNMMGDVDARVGVYYMSNSGAPQELADAALALLRGEDWIPVADRKGIAVDPKVLDSYVGAYELPFEQTLTIVRDGRTLYSRQGNDTTKVELMPETPTRFLDRRQGQTITFKKNGAGVVDELWVDMGSAIFTAKRQVAP